MEREMQHERPHGAYKGRDREGFHHSAVEDPRSRFGKEAAHQSKGFSRENHSAVGEPRGHFTEVANPSRGINRENYFYVENPRGYFGKEIAHPAKGFNREDYSAVENPRGTFHCEAAYPFEGFVSENYRAETSGNNARGQSHRDFANNREQIDWERAYRELERRAEFDALQREKEFLEFHSRNRGGHFRSPTVHKSQRGNKRERSRSASRKFHQREARRARVELHQQYAAQHLGEAEPPNPKPPNSGEFENYRDTNFHQSHRAIGETPISRETTKCAVNAVAEDSQFLHGPRESPLDYEGEFLEKNQAEAPAGVSSRQDPPRVIKKTSTKGTATSANPRPQKSNRSETPKISANKENIPPNPNSVKVTPERAALSHERVLPSEKLRRIAGSNSPQKVPRFPPGTAPGDPTVRKITHPNIRDTCKKPPPVEATKDVEKPTPDIAEECNPVSDPKLRQTPTPLQILAEELSASDSDSESSEDIDVSDAGTQCFLPWGFTLEQIDQFLSELPREHALIYKYQLEVLFFAIASKAHPYQPPNPYSAVKLPKARAPPKPKVPPKPSSDATPEVQQKTPPKKPTAKPPPKATATAATKTTAKSTAKD